MCQILCHCTITPFQQIKAYYSISSIWASGIFHLASTIPTCVWLSAFVKNGPSKFSYFQQLTEKTFIVKFCRWLDSNRGPLVSEVTALPTEPHHCLTWIELVCDKSNITFEAIGQSLKVSIKIKNSSFFDSLGLFLVNYLSPSNKQYNFTTNWCVQW